MAQDQQAATKPFKATNDSPRQVKILVGVLWLLLAVALLAYFLLYEGRVELSWETATEQNTAGFNVYRSDRPDEGFVQINAEQLIDSRGDPVSGASYIYVDNQVIPGETYYYVLEEVELNGSQRRHMDEIFQYSVPEAPWGVAVIALVSALAGTWLVVVGIREERGQ